MVVEVLLAVCRTSVARQRMALRLVLVKGPSGVATDSVENGSETQDGVGVGV
jgi:hypothetical protein